LERVSVSGNTIKPETTSIYPKLGLLTQPGGLAVAGSQPPRPVKGWPAPRFSELLGTFFLVLAAAGRG
jgi:hypothetical protein